MLHCYSAWLDQKWKMYCQWRAGVWQLSVLSSSLCWYGDSTQWLATTLLSVLWHYSYTENWFQTSRLAHQAQPLVTTGIPFKLPSPPAQSSQQDQIKCNLRPRLVKFLHCVGLLLWSINPKSDNNLRPQNSPTFRSNYFIISEGFHYMGT